MSKGAVLFCLALTMSAAVARAQDPKQIVQTAVNTELAADKNDHSHWIYKESDKKPEQSVVQWVAETSQGDVKRVLEENGQKISEDEQGKRMQSFIHDTSAQAKQRSAGQHDDQQAENMLKLLPVAFIWTVTGNDGTMTTLHFKPDPQFNPPTREARVFAAMEGDMVVDNKQHRIASLKGRLIHDVDFGFGLLGRLKAGGSFGVERRETGHGVWQITETHVHIQGHELLFKEISEQEDDVKTHFQPEPNDVTMEQAAQALMKQSE